MGRAKGERGARGGRRKAAIVKTSGRDGNPLCALAFCTWMSDWRFAMFPKDISSPPREWAERFFNVQRWTEYP